MLRCYSDTTNLIYGMTYGKDTLLYRLHITVDCTSCPGNTGHVRGGKRELNT